VECTADDQCRQAGACDPSTGTCGSHPKSDGSPCDDGDACTAGDRCTGGVCAGDASPDGDGDGVCDEVDTCAFIADPAQADADGDGIGDLCQCTAPAPGRCIAGGGSTRTDCHVEFLTAGRLDVNRRATKLKRTVRCTDGDPACDLDGAPDGTCSFGLALCFGSADPRYPQCTPLHVRSIEVVGPRPSGHLPADQRRNVEAIEAAVAALGLEVRRGNQVVASELAPVGDGFCGPLVRLTVPAPTKGAMRRTFKLRGVAMDGRRDTDRIVLACHRYVP
jgi:hypothetical protein